MSTVREPARELKVIENVDVVVAGGGPAGIAAAAASARHGCKVLLLERYGFLGGLATGGLMGPLFGYGFGRTGLILGGIPVEIVRRLQKMNAAPPEAELGGWNSIRFDPESLKHVSDALVLESGVKLLLHAWVVEVVRSGDAIDAVIIESKSGRQAVKAKMFIDATGDGDVANFCGCKYTKGRAPDGRMQSMGTKFKIGGVDMKKAMANLAEEKKRVNQAIDEKRIPAYHSFNGEISEQGVTLRSNEITPTVTRCPGDATNVYDLTRAEVNIRRDTLAIVDFYRQNIPGYENCYLMETPAVVGVRETRQIVGLDILTGTDVLNNRKRPADTIARGCWFIDIHCPLGLYCGKSNLCDKNCQIKPDCHMKTKHRDQLYDTLYQNNYPCEDNWYDIPYGCLVPQSMDNLLVTGRCLSADHGGMASARVIATCFALGEAAGTAAALSLADNKLPRDLPVAKVQENLRQVGVPL
jgi:ribulose 1,5-bisphosphate synthetase/thiazole synthase